MVLGQEGMGCEMESAKKSSDCGREKEREKNQLLKRRSATNIADCGWKHPERASQVGHGGPRRDKKIREPYGGGKRSGRAIKVEQFSDERRGILIELASFGR